MSAICTRRSICGAPVPPPLSIVDTAGADTLDFSGASAGVTVSIGLPGGRAQSIAPWHTTLAITGTIENLTGTKYADVLTGNAANNTVRGLAGNDSLFGGSGRSWFLPSGRDIMRQPRRAGREPRRFQFHDGRGVRAFRGAERRCLRRRAIGWPCQPGYGARGS
jgi:hypothetical protein